MDPCIHVSLVLMESVCESEMLALMLYSWFQIYVEFPQKKMAQGPQNQMT